MKRTIQLLAMLITGVSALAQSFPVVVPGGLANTEGNSSMTEPLNSPSFRMQMVFDASQFAFLGSGTGQISQIEFRIDDAATSGAGYLYAGSTIQLSTTPKGPDSLSPVFAENIGADVTTVRNGAITIGSLYSAGSSPQPFNPTTSITTYFLYSPSMGNLLLDIRAVAGQVIFPGAMDAQSIAGDSVSRVFANANLATSGAVDTLGLVTKFQITVVPEPSVSVVALCGVAFASFFYLRKRI